MGISYATVKLETLRGVALGARFSILDIMYIIGTRESANPVPLKAQQALAAQQSLQML